MAGEKRRFQRVAHDAPATLACPASAQACGVEDISLKGCLLRLAGEWPVDPALTYHLSIHLTYAIHIEMDVVLARREGELAAFRCVGIDADSVAQLKRLVELNLGDPALLEREMQALFGGS